MQPKATLPWGKLIAWSIGIHVILIAISILEVVVYALLINPGKSEQFYTEHAQLTAPVVAVVVGAILFFFVCKRLTKGQKELLWPNVLVLTSAYILVDIALLSLSDENILDNLGLFGLSFGSKALAGYLGAKWSTIQKA